MRWRLRRSATIALVSSPVGLLLHSAARLLIVSDYNVTTAAGILGSGGYINTLLGALLPLVPLLLPYAALALLFFKRVILAALAIAAAVFVSPAAISAHGFLGVSRRYASEIGSWIQHNHGWAVVFAVLGAIVVIVLAILLVGAEFTVFFRVLATILSVGLIPAVLWLYPLPVNGSYYQNQVKQLWLPAEKLTFTDHRTLIIYKLSSDSVFVEALVADSRTIKYLRESDVAAQQVCEAEPAGSGQPLIALFHRNSAVPPCTATPPSPQPGSDSGPGVGRAQAREFP